MPNLGWLTERPIAHRGLHDANNGIIENTPTAVKAALMHGFSIEVDLQLSKDGEAMVFHDFTLDRLTTSQGKVIDRTAKQLKRVKFKNTKDKMWTLSELLQLTLGIVPLVIEIKSRWGHVGPLEQRVAEVLSTYDGPVCIQSFNPYTLKAMKELAPNLTRGLIAETHYEPHGQTELSDKDRFKLRHLLFALEAKPHFIAYNIKDLPACAPLIARLLGMPLLSWTVRTEGDRRTVKKWASQMIFEGFVPENPILQQQK